jgi:hypothetical protein
MIKTQTSRHFLLPSFYRQADRCDFVSGFIQKIEKRTQERMFFPQHIASWLDALALFRIRSASFARVAGGGDGDRRQVAARDEA